MVFFVDRSGNDLKNMQSTKHEVTPRYRGKIKMKAKCDQSEVDGNSKQNRKDNQVKSKLPLSESAENSKLNLSETEAISV